MLFTSGGKVGIVYHKKDESPVYVQGGAVLYVKTSTSNLLDGSFLSIYFSSPRMQIYMDIASSGGTIKHFTLKPANASPIIFPSLSEQQQVGSFFKQLDDTIALHQRKLNLLKLLKQTYLNTLFAQNGENSPALRFAGFSEPWEQRKLGELAEVKTGKAFGSADFNDDGEYLVVTNKNIQDDINGITSVGDRIDIFEETILNNYLLSGNNILVTMDGVNIGKTGKYSNEKAVLAQRVGRLNSEQFEFIYQVTNNNKFLSEMNKLSVGNAIKHISLKQISDYSFEAPINKVEQKKIGTCFKHLDDTIALHKQKVAHLQSMKSIFLNKMFV